MPSERKRREEKKDILFLTARGGACGVAVLGVSLPASRGQWLTSRPKHGCNNRVSDF